MFALAPHTYNKCSSEQGAPTVLIIVSYADIENRPTLTYEHKLIFSSSRSQARKRCTSRQFCLRFFLAKCPTASGHTTIKLLLNRYILKRLKIGF